MIDAPIFDHKDLKLFLPFGCVIAGPSSSGKSSFIYRLISQADRLIEPAPKSVLYCYGEYNQQIPKLQRSGVNLYSGAPTEEVIQRQPKPALVILDDLLYSIDLKFLADLYTKKSHHGNFGIVMLTQDLFDRKMKVVRQNSMYIVLMRAPNSALAIRNLGTQLFPHQLPFFMDAYKQATQTQRYSYLFIDLHPLSNPALRLRTNIFKDNQEEEEEQPLTIFLPKSGW